MKNLSNLAASVNTISYPLAPCEGIFKFRHTLIVGNFSCISSNKRFRVTYDKLRGYN